jgi:hypothetical protein
VTNDEGMNEEECMHRINMCLQKSGLGFTQPSRRGPLPEPCVSFKTDGSDDRAFTVTMSVERCLSDELLEFMPSSGIQSLSTLNQ